MPQVGFEPTILVFKRTKTVDVLDRTVSVIGLLLYYISDVIIGTARACVRSEINAERSGGIV
jgi:hypothetical protein